VTLRALLALALLAASGCATVHNIQPTSPTTEVEAPESELAARVDPARIELVERGRLRPRKDADASAITAHTARVLARALGADDLGPSLETDVELEYAQRPDSRVIVVRMAARTFLPNGHVSESESSLTLVPATEACVADGLDRESLLFVGAALGAFATWSLAPLPGPAGCAVLGFSGLALTLGGASWIARGAWPGLVLEPRFSDAYQAFLVEHAGRVRAAWDKPAREDAPTSASPTIPEAVTIDEAARVDPDNDGEGPLDPVETPY
jgi:hypothetical protein